VDKTTHRGSAVVEEADSLSEWADVIRERFVPLQITPHASADLRGSVRSRHIGHLQASSVRSAPQTFSRTRSQAAAADTELFAVGQIESGTGYLEQDGRRCTVTDGGFALYDTTRPFSWSLDGAWDMRVYTWPRSRVPLSDSELQRLTAQTVPQTSAVGVLLSPMLRRLSGRNAPALSAATAARLADEIAELSLIAATENDAADHPDDAHTDRDLLRKAQVFVEDNLGEPDLGSDTIARELFVSTRTLHRAFARRDLTVATWIKSRRLDACRRALSSRSWDHVPINEVAARHGLTNASFFSRQFVARFGVTPRHYRRQARA
jgi:AraC-like DNA-binding protein